MSLYSTKIVDVIRKNAAGMSKKEIAIVTGIAWSTICKITSMLLQTGVLFEQAVRPKAPGRPKIPLSLNANSALWCGLDIGANTSKVIFCDMGFKVLYATSFTTEYYSTKERFVDWLDQELRTATSDAGVPLETITAVGMSVSGNVDTENGIIVSGGNWGMKYGENLPLASLSKRWGLPVHVVTTMTSAAVAEYNFGLYSGTNNLVAIGLAVGIGSGIIVNHAPLHSHPRSPVGYIGHILIPDNPHKCTCGFTGCLEAYSGGEYLKRIAQEKLPGRPEAWDAAILDRMAAKSAPEAMQIMTKAASYNAVGIAAMVQLYSPDAIVFSGGQSRKDGFLYEMTLQKLWDILPEERRNFVYSVTQLGESQAALGAARLAYERFF